MGVKSTRLLALGILVASLIASITYWSKEARISKDLGPEPGAAQSLSVLRESVNHQEVGGAVVANEPVSATTPEPSTAPARPDAGYYDHPGRSYGVAGLLFFNIILDVSTRETTSAVNKIIEITQVDEDTAFDFLEYMRKAKEDLDRFEMKEVEEMCAQREVIRTIPDLAAAFDKVDLAVESHRATITRGSEAVLGAEGMRNFELHLSSKDRHKKASVANSEARLVELGRSPTEVLAAFCGMKRGR